MGTLVTIVAGRELAQHLFIVRCLVAALALGYIAVLVGMAEDALKSRMLGCAGFQGLPDIPVTATAVAVGYFGTVGQLARVVHLMTLEAVFVFLVFDMDFVAGQAIRLKAVFVMTERAVHLRMLALVGVDFRYYLGMAGVAGIFDVAGKDDMQRLVRVFMTTQAVFQLEVGLVRVAFRALGNERALCNSRGVSTLVTVKAGDVGLVLGAGFFYLLDKGRVAFSAVGDLKICPGRCGGRGSCRRRCGRGRFSALPAAA